MNRLAIVLILTAAACSDPALAPDSPAVPPVYTVAATASVTYASDLDPAQCITAADARVGGAVTIAPCTGAADQQFQWQGTELRSGGLCVDAYSGQGNDWDAIVLWTCHGHGNQQWSFTAAGELRGINGKCIDIPYARATSGSGLMLYGCHDGANQRWVRQPEPAQPSTDILPGDDIQGKVDTHPEGTAFLLKAGVHRLQEISPRDGQQFVGEAGAVISDGT